MRSSNQFAAILDTLVARSHGHGCCSLSTISTLVARAPARRAPTAPAHRFPAAVRGPFRGKRCPDGIEDLAHLVRRLWNADVTNRESQILDCLPARRCLGV